MARGRRDQGRGARLRKTWADVQVDNASIGLTQASLGGISVVELEAHEATILRTRGDFLIVGTPNAGSDVDVIGLGVCVVNEAASSQGGLSIPGPIKDAAADFWLWHRFVPLDAMGAADEATARTGGTSWARVTLDSKAMRRVVEDQAVLLIAESTTGEFGTVGISGGLRFLFGT